MPATRKPTPHLPPVSQDPSRICSIGESVAISFDAMLVRPPGGEPLEAPAGVHWSLRDGLELEIATSRSPFPGHYRGLGSFQQEGDLWAARGVTTDGFLLDAKNLVPETRRDPVWLPKQKFLAQPRGTLADRDAFDAATGRVEADGVLRFSPDSLTLSRSSAEGAQGIRAGLIQCSSVIPWGEVSEVVDKNPTFGGLIRKRDYLEGTLDPDVTFHLRELVPGVSRLVVFGECDEDVERASRHLLLAIGLATGTNCRWIGCREETGRGLQRIHLFAPLDDSVLVPQMGAIPMTENPANTTNFLSLLAAIHAACLEDDLLEDTLGVLRLLWDSVTDPPRMRAPVASTVLDIVLKRVHPRLVDPIQGERADPALLRDVRQALQSSPIAQSPVVPDILRFLKTGDAADSPEEVLLRARHGTSPLVTEREFSSWKEIRNRMAHGWSRYETHNLVTRVGDVVNIVNKIILHVVAFRGHYRNHGLDGWPIEAF